jgi:outer membrane protein
VVTRDQFHKQAEQAEVQFLVAQQDLVLRAAKAYFDVLLAQENLNLVKSQKEAVSQQLAQAQKMFEIGLSSVTDSDEAQARYDTIIASEIAAQNDLEVKANAYRNLTALDPATLLPISAVVADSDIRTDEVRAGLPVLIDQARNDNLSVRAQQLGLEIARFAIDRYRLANAPVVSLVASYGHTLENGSISSSGGRDNTGAASVGLQLSIPLYTGGARNSQLREAVALADQQLNTLEAVQRDAQQLTTQYFLDVASGEARIRALEQARVSASSSLESSKLGREVGVRTTIDVLNAEQNYYQAIYNLVAARYGYLFSKLQLAASVGDLDEKELVGVNRWLVGEPQSSSAPAAPASATPSPVMPAGTVPLFK